MSIATEVDLGSTYPTMRHLIALALLLPLAAAGCPLFHDDKNCQDACGKVNGCGLDMTGMDCTWGSCPQSSCAECLWRRSCAEVEGGACGKECTGVSIKKK